MSQEQKTDWRPSASIETLKQRANIIQHIRAFFAARDVLEVETPIMCSTSVTDPFIESIPALYQAHPDEEPQTFYLQTSPEYAMKRLLAAGSGPIYQISKTFRQGEVGNIHNPEFTMLEWYRPGFDHHKLMDEMDALLCSVLKTETANKFTYAEIFTQHLAIDPHTATLDELAHCAQKHNLQINSPIDDKDDWLNLLLTHCIEPHLGAERPCFIYGYPASQSALAKIQGGNPPTAARFEVYYKGVELANGFYELQDAAEQRRRFELNNKARADLGLPKIKLDERFLAALEAGLPDCAGVALGIDRLVMLALNQEKIQHIISLDISRT